MWKLPQIEDREEFPRRSAFRGDVPPAGTRQKPQNAPGCRPFLPIAENTRIAMPFGETPPVRPHHERHVQVMRRRDSQGMLQDDLRRCRGQKIVPPHDFRHALGGIVHDDGERIPRSFGLARQGEVPQFLAEAQGRTIRREHLGNGDSGVFRMPVEPGGKIEPPTRHAWRNRRGGFRP